MINFKLARRIHATNIMHDFLPFNSIIRFMLTKKNVLLHIVVFVNGLRYKLVYVESLFIASPRYEQHVLNYLKKSMYLLRWKVHIGIYSICASSSVGESGLVVNIEPYYENFFCLNAEHSPEPSN